MTFWIDRFASRLGIELNVVAGVVAVGGVLLALAEFVASGAARVALFSSGLLIAAGPVVYALVRARPPQADRPAKVAGTELPLRALEQLHPRVPAVGILGLSGVGKTTLKMRLLHEVAESLPQTQKITVHIASVISNPTTYVAIVDGRGESASQQFEVAEAADIIFVLLDHEDRVVTGVSEDRLRAHQRFGETLREHLQRKDWRGPVHLLLNKRDLWSSADPGEQDELQAFFAREIEAWSGDRYVAVTSAEHSNEVPNDNAKLVSALKQAWQDLEAVRV
jgi:GTPase SAR1 family protein